MPSLIYLSLQGQCAAVTTHSLLIINITSPLPLFTPLFLTISRLSSSPVHHIIIIMQSLLSRLAPQRNLSNLPGGLSTTKTNQGFGYGYGSLPAQCDQQ